MVKGCSYAGNVFALSCSTVQCTVKQGVILSRSRPMHNCHHVLQAASGQQQRRDDSVAKSIDGWETQRQDEHSHSSFAGSPASGGTNLLHLSNLGKLWCMQTAYHTSLAGLLLELIISRGCYHSHPGLAWWIQSLCTGQPCFETTLVHDECLLKTCRPDSLPLISPCRKRTSVYV